MTAAATAIQDFSTSNPIYANAIVTAYTVDGGGNKTSTLANLYSTISGATLVANPQNLDSFGKFQQPVYINEAVILSVTGLGNTPSHDTGVISAGSQTDITISSAQILAMNVTPITLIGAPGASQAIVLNKIVAALAYDSVGYAGASGHDMTIRYTNSTGPIIGTLTSLGFLDQTEETYAVMEPVGGSLVLPANEPVVAFLTGAVTSGNSPVVARLFYDIIDLTTLIPGE